MGFTAAVVRDRSGIRLGRDLACDARVGEPLNARASNAAEVPQLYRDRARELRLPAGAGPVR